MCDDCQKAYWRDNKLLNRNKPKSERQPRAATNQKPKPEPRPKRERTVRQVPASVPTAVIQAQLHMEYTCACMEHLALLKIGAGKGDRVVALARVIALKKML